MTATNANTKPHHLIENKNALVPASVMKHAGQNCYAVNVSGDCMFPDIPEGSTVICDPDQTPMSGDFVAIWWKDKDQCPIIKKLTAALPRDLMGASCEFELLLMCEQMNPRRRYAIPSSEIKEVHKMIHVLGEEV